MRLTFESEHSYAATVRRFEILDGFLSLIDRVAATVFCKRSSSLQRCTTVLEEFAEDSYPVRNNKAVDTITGVT